MLADYMTACCSSIFSGVVAHNGEMLGFDTIPNSCVSPGWLNCVMEFAQDDQVVWCVRSALRNWQFMVDVKYEPGWAPGDLASAISDSDRRTQLLPKGRIPGPVVEDMDCLLILRPQFCLRIVKVPQLRWRNGRIGSFPLYLAEL